MKESTKDQLAGKAHEVKGAVKEKAGLQRLEKETALSGGGLAAPALASRPSRLELALPVCLFGEEQLGERHGLLLRTVITNYQAESGRNDSTCKKRKRLPDGVEKASSGAG